MWWFNALGVVSGLLFWVDMYSQAWGKEVSSYESLEILLKEVLRNKLLCFKLKTLGLL